LRMRWMRERTLPLDACGAPSHFAPVAPAVASPPAAPAPAPPPAAVAVAPPALALALAPAVIVAASEPAGPPFPREGPPPQAPPFICR